MADQLKKQLISHEREIERLNHIVQGLDLQLQDERGQRECEGLEKAKKVEDLEREIAQTIEGQIKENKELREKLNVQGMYMR